MSFFATFLKLTLSYTFQISISGLCEWKAYICFVSRITRLQVFLISYMPRLPQEKTRTLIKPAFHHENAALSPRKVSLLPDDNHQQLKLFTFVIQRFHNWNVLRRLYLAWCMCVCKAPKIKMVSLKRCCFIGRRQTEYVVLNYCIKWPLTYRPRQSENPLWIFGTPQVAIKSVTNLVDIYVHKIVCNVSGSSIIQRLTVQKIIFLWCYRHTIISFVLKNVCF